MHILKKMLFVISSITLALFITACGYKPTSYYAKEEIKGNVFANVSISLEDPKNSVLIKDAVYKLLIQKLDANIVEKESLADVVLNVNLNSVSMSALQYDKEGYNKLYRALIVINFEYFKKSDGIRKHFTVDGEYNFSVDDGTTITDSKRFEAISLASDKALSEVLSKIAVSSFK